MNRPQENVSRHPRFGLQGASPRNMRLGMLVLALIAIYQLDDPMVGATVGQEIVYWVVRNSVLIAGLLAADILVARRFEGRLTQPEWLKPVVLVSVFGLLPLALAEILIEPHLPMRPEFVDDDLWAVSPLLAFLSEYATLLSIVVPIHLLLWVVIDRSAVLRREAAEPAAQAMPAFLAQGTGLKAADVLALQAEEHYVRIYTRRGAELLHYRVGDAVREMPEGMGLQVHRSWWVSANAIRSAKRGSRRWQLELVCDVAVPVSDSYVKAVREKGWLKRRPAG